MSPRLNQRITPGFLRSLILTAGLIAPAFSSLLAATTDGITVKNAPQLNQGRIKGGVRVMTGSNFNLNSGLVVDGSLRLPGAPQFRFNGNFVPPPIQDGSGAATPDAYRVTINNGVSLGGITRRVDPELLPTLTSPSLGTGTRTVNINQPNDSPGDFKTLRTLTLNAQGAHLTLPPGRYERVTLNSGCTLQLQQGTREAPSIFEIQRLDCNGGSHIAVSGPVVLRIKNSLNLNGFIGDASHPEWTELQISDGSLTLNSASAYHGKALIPNGRVTVNGNSLFHGIAFTADLTLNGGTIECEPAGGTPNLPPIASSSETSGEIDLPLAVGLVAVDPENSTLSYTITSDPSHGDVWLDGSTAVYTPDPGFIGDDSFQFTASDGLLHSSPATVVIHVFQPNRPPVAKSQAFVINQGEMNAPVTLSAVDPDEDSILYQLVGAPRFGSISGTPPNLLYSHTGPRSKTPLEDSFTFTATDSHGAVSAIATINLQLQPVNRTPAASPFSALVNEDGMVSLHLDGADPDGDSLTYAIVADPASPQSEIGPLHGKLTGTAPDLAYQPDENFHGSDRFFYQISDGQSQSAPAEVRIEVTSVNDIPTANAQSVSLSEDHTASIQMTASDPDDASLAFHIATPPAWGTLTGSPPNVIYTPAANFHGEDSFTFTASDSSGASSDAEFHILVTPVNDPPTANAASFNLAEDATVAIQLQGLDVDGDSIEFQVTGGPQHGVLSGSAPEFIYQPHENFHGTDQFFITASDGEFVSQPVAITIVVLPANDPPTAAKVSVEGSEDTAILIRLAGEDIDGDTPTYRILQNPSHGHLVGTPPDLEYIPEPNYNGVDVFSFVASDGESESLPAEVNLTIHPVADAPVSIPSIRTLRQHEQVTFVLEGTSVDNESLSQRIIIPPAHGSIVATGPGFTYTPHQAFSGTDFLTFVSTADISGLESEPAVVTFEVTANNLAPAAPDLEVTLDGNPIQIHLDASDPEDQPLSYSLGTEAATYVQIEGWAPNLTLSRKQAAAVQTTFSYTVTDDQGLSATGTVHVRILAANRQPVVSGPGGLTMTEDSTLAFRVIATDPDNDPLTYSIDLPAGSPCVISGNGPEFLLSLAPNFFGSASFAARVADGRGGSASRTVFLTVANTNDGPVFSTGNHSTAEDQSVTLSLPATDPEGSTITYAIQTSPLHGKLSGTLPNVTYNPDPNFTGDDSFVVSASDGSLISSATVRIHVNPVNDAPVVERISRKFSGRETTIPLQGSDADGDSLSYRLLAPPGIGQASISGNLLSFTTSDPFLGTLHLRYVANDGTQDSQPAALVLTGGFAPEGRIITPQAGARLAVGEPVEVLSDAHDPDGTIIRYDLFSSGALVASSATPGLLWTPSQTGATELTLRFTDDSALSFTSAPLHVTVIGTNQSPVVFAGSDRNVFPLGLGANLLHNGGCELPMDANGDVPFWQSTAGSQSLTQANVESFNPPNVGSYPYRHFPLATEGSWYFGPRNAETSAFAQETAKLSQVAPLAGAMRYLFKAKIQATLPEGGIAATPDYRQPRIELNYIDDSGATISTQTFQSKIPDNVWYPVSLNLDKPAAATAVRVSLIAYREPGCGLFHYSLFDDVGIYPVTQASPVNLTAVVSDDGLPTYGSLNCRWEQLEGPNADILRPNESQTPVKLTGFGKHLFKLTANDGEKSASDVVEINVGSDSDDNAPPSIGLASEMSVTIGSTQHSLAATVTDDGKPGSTLYHYWEQVSGPAPAAFTDPRAATTKFSVSVPGAYVFRLTSHDGSLAAQRDIHIQANCETTRQPIDLYIITDHTPSMFGPEPGVITDTDPRTPIYQARKLVTTLLKSLDPSIDRVSINKNDSAPTNTAMPFTTDFALAATKVIKPSGENLTEGYSSLVVPAIQRAATYVRTNSRPEAKKIILHLNDGVSGAPDSTPTAAQIAGYGITTFSVTMPNLKNDPINRLEISRFVSTPAHAFFVSSMADNAVLDGFFKLAFSSLCRGYNTPPTVTAGSATYLPSVNSVFQPQATVSDDQDVSTLSLTWSQVSGPAQAIFSEMDTIRPAVRFTEPGSYLLRLIAADGNTSSSDTVLVIVGVAHPTPTPTGLIAYWPFDGTTRDLVGARTLSPHYPHMPAVFSTDARSGLSIDLNGRTHPLHQIDGELFKLHGALGGMAVSFWCKTPATATSGMIFQFAGYSNRLDGQPNWASPGLGAFYDPTAKRLRFDFELQNQSSTSLTSHPSTGTIEAGQWNHIVVNYDPANGNLSIFVNGILTNTGSYDSTRAPVFARNGQGLCLGAAPNSSGVIDWAGVSTQPMFKGVVDEIALFNRSLTSADIANLVNRNSGLIPPSLNPPPIVDAGRDRVASLTQPEILLEGLATDDNPALLTRWSLQSGPITGCAFTDSSQAQTTAVFSQPGIYTIRLEADDGYQVASDTVEIRVDQGCSRPLPANTVFWFKGNGDGADAVSGRYAHWLNAASYVDGKVGSAFHFTGASSWVESEALNLAGMNEFTLEGWFKDNSTGLVEQNLFEISSSGLPNDANSLKAITRTTSGGIRYIQLQVPFLDSTGVVRTGTYLSSASLSSSSYPLGSYYHLAITFSKSAGVSFFVNGIQIRNEAIAANLVSFKPPTNPVLRLGGRNTLQVYPKLSVDEFSMYSRRLDPSELLAIQQADSTGKCPPWAQSPANSAFVDAGSSATLPDAGNHQFAGTYEVTDFGGTPSPTWSQVSGPASVSLSDSATLAPSGDFETPGRYVFRLFVSDGANSGEDTVIVDLLRAGNHAPVIDWSPPSFVQLPERSLVFAPVVTDDGLPNNNLTATWRMVSGPEGLHLTDDADTSDRFDAQAVFSAPGGYELELLVSDGALTASRTFHVEVIPEPAPPTPNEAPSFSLGMDITAVSKTVHLFPTILDDGKPNHQITATWDYDKGPAAPSIDTSASTTTPEAFITFPAPGEYEIRLTVSDGEQSSSDVVTIDVPAILFGNGLNAAPILSAMPTQVVSLPATQITLAPLFTDSDGPAAAYTYSWEQVGGPSDLGFSSTNGASSTITFPVTGAYTVKFTLTDGPFVRSIFIPLEHLTKPNTAPTLTLSPGGGQAVPMSTVTMTANAVDDGLPGDLTYEWDWLSSPDAGAPVFSAPNSGVTQVTFPAAGDYILYCRVSDGELSKHQTVSWRVAGEPYFEILAPQTGSTISDEFVPEVHIRAFQDGGIVNSVAVILDGSSLGQAKLEPDSVDYFMKLPPMLQGSHSLVATLTLGDGTILTRSSTFQLAEFAEEALELEIASPHEYTDNVTAPTPVVGTVRSPQLKDYKLEIAPIDSPQSKRVIAAGTAQVSSAAIGTLDPTLLQNGLHLLTLSGTTTNGLYAATTEKVMIDGNMKLGQFSLAFEDLSVNLPGTPLSIKRVYDSRDAKGGDFGPGWSLATSAVKVRKTRPLDAAWEQVAQTSGFVTNWVFQIHPTQRKRVIISFPDGRTEIFDTGIRASVPARSDLPCAQRYSPIYSAKYLFTPVGSSQGKLEVEGDTEITWLGSGNDFVNHPVIEGQFTAYSESASNPSRFRYTEPGGASYIIDETLGLMAISDANGNTVTINRGGVHHSAGESLLFTRDTAGRITKITDPSGKFLTYQYDTQGRLVTVTNRVGSTNKFVYGNTTFPHYLTAIDDGKNIRAVRTNYDAEGRMVSQTDANGHSVTFNHSVSNHRETITDRLGNITVHEFDDFGNIIRSTNPLGGLTTRSYDARDNETSVSSPLGHLTRREYDSYDNLLAETDPLGNVTRYTYDSERLPTSITDALNHASAMNYGSGGRLLSMSDPSGAATAFAYGPNGTLASITDANGTASTYTHDAKGRVKSMKVTASDGSPLASETYDYDLMGNRVRSITFDGDRYLTTTFAYDGENRLYQTTHPDGTVSTTNYDPNGKIASQSTPAGTTSFTYDARGNLIRTTYPGTGRFTTIGYDVEGRKTSATDLAGNTTYTLYDALGRATATILPDATMPATVLTEVADIASEPLLADNPRSLTTYDADGRAISSTDPNGNTTTYEYDAAGRCTAVVNALGQRVSFTYDASGRQTSFTDAKGNATSYTLDSAGRLTRTDFTDGTFTLSTYDTLGRRISATDAEGQTTRYAYDPQGRLLAVTDPLGQTTRYTYDWRGLQTSQTDALGRITRYEYDVMGRRTARILPEGQREEMTYNTLGQLIAHKDFNGQIITRSYEAYTQNLLSIVPPAAHPSLTLSHAPARYDFTYDILGHRTGATVRNKAGAILSQETFTYDKQSRLTGYSGPTGGIGYAYDLAGNLSGAKSNTAGGYDLSYDYDALNRLIMVHRGQQGIDPAATELASCNYDANGNLNGTGYANGIQHAYTYNTVNRLTHLMVGTSGPAGPTSVLQGYAYQLDRNGLRTHIAELSGRSISNSFDALQRLTRESITSSLPPSHFSLGTLTYTYDVTSNRTSRTSSGTVSQLLPNQSHSFSANDHLTSDTYDANGNTLGGTDLSSNSFTDVYSFDNRLIRRTRNDGTTIDLTYNPDGHRLTKLVSQSGLTQRVHHYLTDPNNPTGYSQVVEEKNPLAPSGQQLQKVHLYGHDLIATEQRDSSNPQSAIFNQQFYAYDGLGSVRGITNETGDLTETYDYDAYGNLIGLAYRNAEGVLESTPITDHPAPITRSDFLFTGEQWDADLCMYFLRARYLNTQTGRFHTQDTYEGRNGEPATLHKYAYCHGNPVNRTDPSGHVSLAEQAATGASLTGLAGMSFTFVNMALTSAGVSPSITIRLEGFNRILFGTSAMLSATAIAPEAPNVSFALLAWGSDEMIAGWIQLTTGVRQHSQFANLLAALGVPHADFIAGAAPGILMLPKLLVSGYRLLSQALGADWGRLFSATTAAPQYIQLEFGFVEEIRPILFKGSAYNPSQLRPGEFQLHLPDLGDDVLNWQQNFDELKRFAEQGIEFRELHPLELGGWLQRERNHLFYALGYLREITSEGVFWRSHPL